uniref:Ig-like domain-containing protein n=1 Tax=Amphiprion percula TaxID=161767 RepID=A0A3P8RWE9_AMPPE
MIVLWIMMLVLHQGHTLMPVIPVEVSESTTFTCALHDTEISTKIHWYKQRLGDDLKLIVILQKSLTPQFEPEFSNSRWKVNNDDNFSNLTILSTIQEDEGIYHCAVIAWFGSSKWTGTYLIVKGDSQKTSDYTVVQQSTASHSVHPGESQTLHCSVFSDSENKTCSGDLSVFWFRPGSDKSHPDIIYTDGNRPDECEKRSDTQKSCVYHSSKTFSSSDAGTYYCAVATCGQILFGNGNTLTNDACSQTAQSEMIGLVTAITCLAISVIVNIVLICYRTQRAAQEQFTGIEFTSSQARHDNLRQSVVDTTEGGHDLNYAALHFSGRKATQGKKKTELTPEESVYSQVKYQM